MKAILISGTDRLLEDLRRGVEAEGYEVTKALLRKPGQALSPLLVDSIGDLLIVDSTGAQMSDDLAALEMLAGTNPYIAVIMLGANRDTEALLAAMRAGVREVLESPPTPADLSAALRHINQRKQATLGDGVHGRVIAFMACKGGSGATFLATNLAYLLATEHKKNTAFIDLDLQYGDASYYMTDTPGKANIADLARQIDRLDAKLLASSMVNIAPILSLLSAPEEPEAALGITAYQLERVLDIARKNYDFVVLDLERMLDAVSIKALDKAELVFLVMENMVPHVRGAKRLVHSLRTLGYPDSKLRLIVNRYEKGNAIDLANIEEVVNLKGACPIQNSFAEVSNAINTGVPLVKINPNNPVVRGLREIAHALTETNVVGVPKARSWFSRLTGEHA